MKLVCLINDNTKDTIDYIYQDKNNRLYGYSLNVQGYFIINSNILNELINIIKIDKNINNVDNYAAFFLKNYTQDYILYSSEKSNKNNKNVTKKVVINGIIIILTSSLLMSLIKFAVNDINPISAVNYASSMFVYDISQCLNFDINILTKDEAIDLIYNSTSLPYDFKIKFVNRDLFDDVYPYYHGTKMEYIIKNKLTDLSFEKYGFTNPNYYNSSAYYDELEPNVIHINKVTRKVEKDSGHEFVHVLQYPFLNFKYIREATASIINWEYFDENDKRYSEAAENIRLLMDVIGPKIIWQYIFSGDEESLELVLKEFLNEKDFNKLIELLSKEPDDANHKIITELISKLYLNKYQKDIKSDYNIFDMEGNIISDKIYFNHRKENKITHHIISAEEGIKKGLIKEETYYAKIINESDIMNYDENGTFIEKRLVGNNCEIVNIDNEGMINLKFKWYSKTVTKEQAIKRNYVKYEYLLYVNKTDLNKYQDLRNADLPPVKKLESVSQNVSLSTLAPTYKLQVIIRIDNILNRFPEDIITKSEEKDNILSLK